MKSGGSLKVGDVGSRMALLVVDKIKVFTHKGKNSRGSRLPSRS